MQQNNKIHNRVHWRRIKNLLNGLSSVENVDVNRYNFSNICCYKCTGIELQGKNVKYKTRGNNSCWVDDNSYEVFEVPHVTNKYRGYGSFIFLAHNTSFDYWVFGEMTYQLDYSKTQGSTSTHDNVYYIPYGIYTIGDENAPTTIKKTVFGKNATYGGKGSKLVMFDSCGNRMKAHRGMESRTVDQVNKTRNRYKKSVNKNTDVKIYKIKHK